MTDSYETSDLSTSLNQDPESRIQQQEAKHDIKEDVWRHLVELEGEIRVFSLLPSPDPDAPIHIELRIVSLNYEYCPKYECISYCWGTPVIMQNIFLEGEPFPCPANLVTALRYLREPAEKRTLWADALCINQTEEGVGERSEQVQHMGDIFSSAAKVISWVCEAEAWTCMLFDILKIISARRETQQDYAAAGYPGAKDNLPLFTTVVKLLWKPYFSRLWMAQELSLAKSCEVRLGRETMEFTEFGESIMKVGRAESEYRKENMVVGATRTDAILNVLQYTSMYTLSRLFSDPGPLCDAVAISRRLQCYDAKDKVYGVLALTFLKLKVDYRKDTEYVYREAAIARIVASESLDVFIYAWDCHVLGKASLGSSWVPNWEVTDLDLLLIHTLMKSTSEHFSASAKRHPVIHAMPSSKFCFIQAIHVDTVAKTGQTWLSLPFDSIDWPSIVQERVRYWKTFSNTEDNVWWKVMLHDLIRIGSNAARSERRLQSSDYALLEIDKLISTETVDPLLMWPILGRIRQPLNRKPCVTASGMFGQVPAAAEPGDSIFILVGSDLPWVLRPYDEEGDKAFQLVGPCYFSGIMNGELVDRSTEPFDLIKLY